MSIFGFGFNGFGQLLPDCDGMQKILHPTKLNIGCMECEKEDVSMVTANWSTTCFLMGNNKKVHLQGFCGIEQKHQKQQISTKFPFPVQHVSLKDEELIATVPNYHRSFTWKYSESCTKDNTPRLTDVKRISGNEELDCQLKCVCTDDMCSVAVTGDLHAGEIEYRENVIFRPFYLQVPVNQVSCGKEHVLLLSNTGDVYSLGLGSRGQLGHGTSENENKPKVIEALQGVAMATIAAGGWHSAAVSGIGDVYIWGWNESGQLGLPMKNTPNREQKKDQSPNSEKYKKNALETEVNKQTDIHLTSEVLKQNNDKKDTKNLCMNITQNVETSNEEQRFCTSHGTSRPSCLEDNSTSDVIVLCQMFPCLLDFGDEVTMSKVSCGSRHTAAVSDDGDLYTWGWNEYGQLGHGDNVTRDVITLVQYFKDSNCKVNDVTCGPWNTIVTVAMPTSTQ